MEGKQIGYVVKRYPRYSETFVVREILAHEAAGIGAHIFALRSSNDTHFQNAISLIRAPVTYLHAESISANELWLAIEQTRQCIPQFWRRMDAISTEDGRTVYQALLLAREAVTRGISHLHAPFAHKGASVARLASLITGIPYSFTARAKDVFPLEVDPDDFRRKLRDASAVITVSDYHVNYLRERYGSAAAHVQRIYNGLDLEMYSFSSPEKRAPLILSVGRLVEKKGFEDLIKACEILSRNGTDFKCLIIGEGYLESLLRAQIQQMDLQSRVELLGPKPELEVIQYMRSAAVFALPCVVSGDQDQDGLPNVIFESMALGTPCVSTDVAGIPEILKHEKTGLLVPQRDANSLAAAIDRLLEDANLRSCLATQARALIEREFDIRRNASLRRDLFWPAHKKQEFRCEGSIVMRIAYISADAGVPVFGAKGCSVHVQEMIRALRSHGATVELFSNSVEGDRPSDFHDLVVHELPRPVGKYHEREISALDNNKSLTDALETYGPYDLLYERYSLWSFAAMEHARTYAVPGILEVNAPLIEEQERYRYLADREAAEKVAYRVFSSANHLIAVSRQVGCYVQQFQPRTDRVHVIPNGVNPDRFPAGLPALFPASENIFTVGFLGSLKQWHGLPILVEAFHRIYKNNPYNLRLLIIGDGPERNPLLQELENRSLKNCCLLPGQVASHQVAAALASMNVGVAPYPHDDFFYFSPLKVLEYMAAGLPVVASKIGQISEIIRHDETGILCPPGNVSAIAEALERLRDSANLRMRLGAAARAEVLRNYNWKLIAGQILNLFSEVQVV